MLVARRRIKRHKMILFELGIERRARPPSSRSGWRRTSARTSGRFAGVRIQDHIQPLNRFFIVFAPSAHITNPCWEMRHRDQLLAEPRKICNATRQHNARMAFTTQNNIWIFMLNITHVNSLLCSEYFCMFNQIPHGRGPVDQDRFANHIFGRQKTPIF